MNFFTMLVLMYGAIGVPATFIFALLFVLAKPGGEGGSPVFTVVVHPTSSGDGTDDRTKDQEAVA